MLADLQHIASPLLSMFMVALAFFPLVFVWQDRNRKQADRRHVQKLQHEARLAERLRLRRLEADPDPMAIGMGISRQKNVIG